MQKINLIALGCGIFLRLALLPSAITTPLWYDENFTLLVARLPWDRMMEAVRGDVHPPLFYILIIPFARIAPWGIRIPAIIAGILALFVFWAILGRLLRSQTAIIGAFVLYCISSQALYYSIEGRMYEVLSLFVLLAFLFILERKWILLGITTALILYTHNYGCFYAACLAPSALILTRDLKKVLITFGLAGLSFLPWLSSMFHQMHIITNNYWIMPISAGSLFYSFFQGFNIIWDEQVMIWSSFIFFGWMLFSLLWMLEHRSWFRVQWGWTIPIIFVFGVFALSILVSILWQPVDLYRGYVPAIPFLLIMLALPLSEPLPRYVRIAAIILLIPFIGLLCLRMYAPQPLKSVDDQKIKTLSSYIDAHWKPGDTILNMGDGSWIDIQPYTKHPGQDFKTPMCGPVSGSLSPTTRAGLGEQYRSYDQLIKGGRVWFITAVTPLSPSCEAVMADQIVGIQKPLIIVRQDQLISVSLYLMEPNGH